MSQLLSLARSCDLESLYVSRELEVEAIDPAGLLAESAGLPASCDAKSRPIPTSQELSQL
jgi:hypothetical protein